MPITLFLTAIGTWAGFANPLWHFPAAALLLPAGLYALGAGASSWRRAAGASLLAGWLGYLGGLYWIAVPVMDFSGLSSPWAELLGGICPPLLALYMALYAMVFALGARFAAHRLSLLPAALMAGMWWLLLEWVRGWLFTGFPWLALPYAFAPWPEMLQFAALAGSHGLSALIATAACLALGNLLPPYTRGAQHMHGPRPSEKRLAVNRILAFLVGTGLLGMLWGHGYMTLAAHPEPDPDAPELFVGLIQGNIPQEQKWEPVEQMATVGRYAVLSRGALSRRKDPSIASLLVWPETAMPFFVQDPSDMTYEIRDLAKDTGAALVTGAPGYAYGIEQPTIYYNRAFLVAPEGSFSGYYDKEHLVPFGEYVPLGDYLPFLKKLAQGAVGDFSKGVSLGPLKPFKPLGSQGVHLALGMLICYETIFPELAWKRVDDGANLLVNISNDAWFGRTSAPVQHLQMCTLRAVEQGRWLVRATNTGISAIIDPQGRIVQRSELFRATGLTGTVRLLDKHTPYHALAGYVIPAAAVCWVLLALAALFTSPRRAA